MQHLARPFAVGCKDHLVVLELALALALGLVVEEVDVVGPNRGKWQKQGCGGSGCGSLGLLVG